MFALTLIKKKKEKKNTEKLAFSFRAVGSWLSGLCHEA